MLFYHLNTEERTKLVFEFVNGGLKSSGWKAARAAEIRQSWVLILVCLLSVTLPTGGMGRKYSMRIEGNSRTLYLLDWRFEIRGSKIRDAKTRYNIA